MILYIFGPQNSFHATKPKLNAKLYALCSCLLLHTKITRIWYYAGKIYFDENGNRTFLVFDGNGHRPKNLDMKH